MVSFCNAAIRNLQSRIRSLNMMSLGAIQIRSNLPLESRIWREKESNQQSGGEQSAARICSQNPE